MKMESEGNSNKSKTCISPRSRTKLIHEIYISKKVYERKDTYLQSIPEN